MTPYITSYASVAAAVVDNSVEAVVASDQLGVTRYGKYFKVTVPADSFLTLYAGNAVNTADYPSVNVFLGSTAADVVSANLVASTDGDPGLALADGAMEWGMPFTLRAPGSSTTYMVELHGYEGSSYLFRATVDPAMAGAGTAASPYVLTPGTDVSIAQRFDVDSSVAASWRAGVESDTFYGRYFTLTVPASKVARVRLGDANAARTTDTYLYAFSGTTSADVVLANLVASNDERAEGAGVSTQTHRTDFLSPWNSEVILPPGNYVLEASTYDPSTSYADVTIAAQLYDDVSVGSGSQFSPFQPSLGSVYSFDIDNTVKTFTTTNVGPGTDRSYFAKYFKVTVAPGATVQIEAGDNNESAYTPPARWGTYALGMKVWKLDGASNYDAAHWTAQGASSTVSDGDEFMTWGRQQTLSTAGTYIVEVTSDFADPDAPGSLTGLAFRAKTA
jgi:hypothetical protein